MPFNTKPTKPRWADGSPSYAVEPSESKKTIGWLSQEKPPFQWMNWLFLKIKQWLDWFEDRDDFQDSVSFYTTGGSIDWSGSVITIPTGGMRIEWRDAGSIINNILPAGTYNLADGQYLIFIPHNVSGTSLALGSYETLSPGQYAITAGGSLIEKTGVQEIILFRRRGASAGTAVLEVPLFKTAVQAGGSLAANDLLVHKHSDPDDGGKLDWDECWADAVHNHSSAAEGGTSIGPVTSLTAANNIDIGDYQLRARQLYADAPAGTAPLIVDSTTKVANLNAELLDGYDTYSGTNPSASGRIPVTQTGGWLYTPNSAPTADYHIANKKYVDDKGLGEIRSIGNFMGTSFINILYNPTYLNPIDYHRSFIITNIDSSGNFRIQKNIELIGGIVYILRNYVLEPSTHVVIYDLPDDNYTIYEVDSVVDWGSYFQCHAVGSPNIYAVYGSSARGSIPFAILSSYSNNTCHVMIHANAINFPGYNSSSSYLYFEGHSTTDIALCAISGIGYQDRNYVTWGADNGIWVGRAVAATYGGLNAWRFEVEISQAYTDTLCYHLTTTIIPRGMI